MPAGRCVAKLKNDVSSKNGASETRIARIVGDVATLAFKWNKPLAARLLPAPGKKGGEMTEFSGALANAIIQPMIGSLRR